MAEDGNEGNYLAAYCRFFAEFVKKVNPNDQLPVKVCTYDVTEGELVGEIISVALQYLNQIYCPPCLQGHLIHRVLEDIKAKCRTHPEECGLRSQEKTYAPLKLMQAVTSKLYEICHTQYLNNSQLALWPPPPANPLPIVVASALKNRRRKMEDRHVVLHNLHSIFNVQSDSVANYYAVFDGHGGQDAAIYCATHLHQYLVESIYYPTDLERALRDAFLSTDAHFVKKAETHKVNGGSTAVCVLLMDRKMYTAWVGDSRAMIVRQGQSKMLVCPHRPYRADEVQRISDMGGIVTSIMGVLRVQGVLGVTRAIGDVHCKPYVTGEPEIHCEELDGTEDFILIACDGFWDFVNVAQATSAVYENLQYNTHNVKDITINLVRLAKICGSQDNITVILVFLRPPTEIAPRPKITGSSNKYPRYAPNDMDILGIDESKRGGLMEGGGGEFEYLAGETRQGIELEQRENGDGRPINDSRIVFEASSNGKHENGEEYEDDEDLGPETDVDALDDVVDATCTPLEKLSRELFPEEKSGQLDDENEARFDEKLELRRNEDERADDAMHADDDESPPSPRSNKPLQHALISEADNVADSEDSEDEWNYYRIDPNKEKEEEQQQPQQQQQQEQQHTSPLDDEETLDTKDNDEANEDENSSSCGNSNSSSRHQSPEPFDKEDDRHHRNPLLCEEDSQQSLVGYEKEEQELQLDSPVSHEEEKHRSTERIFDEIERRSPNIHEEICDEHREIEIHEDFQRFNPQEEEERHVDEVKEDILSTEIELDDKCEKEEREKQEVSSELIETDISAETTLEKTSTEWCDTTVVESSKVQEEEDMETSFQLNPDAKEFVPVSPLATRMNLMPGVISGSPLKHNVTMDDIPVPTQKEFEEEVSKRPHEFEGEEDEEEGRSNGGVEQRGNDFVDFFGEKQKIGSAPPPGLDESEISSTKAEFGDESSTSFLTATEFHRTGISMDNSYVDSERGDDYDIAKDPMAMSFTPSDLEAALDVRPVDLNAVHMLDDDDEVENQETQGIDEVSASQEIVKSPDPIEPVDSIASFENEPVAEECASPITQEDLLACPKKQELVEETKSPTDEAQFEPREETEILQHDFHVSQIPSSEDTEDILGSPTRKQQESVELIDQSNEHDQITKSELSSPSLDFGTDLNVVETPGGPEQYSSTFEGDISRHAEEGSEEPTALLEPQNLQSTANDQDTPSVLSPVPDTLEIASTHDTVSPTEDVQQITENTTESTPDIPEPVQFKGNEFWAIQRLDLKPSRPNKGNTGFCLTIDREQALLAAMNFNLENASSTNTNIENVSSTNVNFESAFLDNVGTSVDASVADTRLESKSDDEKLLEFDTEFVETKRETPQSPVSHETGEDAAPPTLDAFENTACPFGSSDRLTKETIARIENNPFVDTQNMFNFEDSKSAPVEGFTGLERELEFESSTVQESVAPVESLSESIGGGFTRLEFESSTISQSAAPVESLPESNDAFTGLEQRELKLDESSVIPESMAPVENVSEPTDGFTGLERELGLESDKVPESITPVESLTTKDVIFDISTSAKPSEPVTSTVPETILPASECTLSGIENTPEDIGEIVQTGVEATENERFVDDIVEKQEEVHLTKVETKPVDEASEKKEPMEIALELNKESEITKVVPTLDVETSKESKDVKETKEKQAESVTSPVTVSAVAAVAGVTAAGVAAATAAAVSSAKSKPSAKPTAKTTTKPSTTSKTAKPSPASSKSAGATATRVSVSSTATKKAAPSTNARPKSTDAVKKEEKPTVSSSITKTTSKTVASKSTTSATKPTAPRPSSAATKSRVSTSSTKPTTSSVADKKPTANGDVKAPAKTLATKSTSKPATSGASTTAKTSTVTKTSTTRASTGLTAAKPRPATTTAPSKSSTVSRTSTSAATSRPRTAPAVTSTTTTAMSPTSNSLSKPRTLVGKSSPVIEKQIKETANKQISARSSLASASKTTTATRTSTSSSATTRRVASTRTTSGTTTVSPSTKKPVASKVQSRLSTGSKSTVATPKSKIVQNGVSENAEIANKIEDDVPRKDLSPVTPPTDNQLIMSAD